MSSKLPNASFTNCWTQFKLTHSILWMDFVAQNNNFCKLLRVTTHSIKSINKSKSEIGQYFSKVWSKYVIPNELKITINITIVVILIMTNVEKPLQEENYNVWISWTNIPYPAKTKFKLYTVCLRSPHGSWLFRDRLKNPDCWQNRTTGK